MLSFEKISARFNKHPSVRGKYVISKGEYIDSGEVVIRFPEVNGFQTLITTGAIESSSTAEHFIERISGITKYDLVDGCGKIIGEKNAITSASGVIINGRTLFFVPGDAVLPLCNLLNLLQSTNR